GVVDADLLHLGARRLDAHLAGHPHPLGLGLGALLAAGAALVPAALLLLAGQLEALAGDLLALPVALVDPVLLAGRDRLTHPLLLHADALLDGRDRLAEGPGPRLAGGHLLVAGAHAGARLGHLLAPVGRVPL